VVIIYLLYDYPITLDCQNLIYEELYCNKAYKISSRSEITYFRIHERSARLCRRLVGEHLCAIVQLLELQMPVLASSRNLDEDADMREYVSFLALADFSSFH
jgi:hypothetical protein